MSQNFKDIAASIVATSFLAIASQVDIDLKEVVGMVPITLQSLAVLVVACVLPIRLSVAAVILYLLLGALGVGVFAGGAGGLEVFSSGSGGFLIGFLISTVIVGLWATPLDTYSDHMKGHMIGTGFLLLSGWAWISYQHSMSIAWEHGVLPYLPGAAVKILVGAIVSWLLRPKVLMLLGYQLSQ